MQSEERSSQIDPHTVKVADQRYVTNRIYALPPTACVHFLYTTDEIVVLEPRYSKIPYNIELAQFGEAIIVKGKFVPVPKRHAMSTSKAGGSEEASHVSRLENTDPSPVMENQQLLLRISKTWEGLSRIIVYLIAMNCT